MHARAIVCPATYFIFAIFSNRCMYMVCVCVIIKRHVLGTTITKSNKSTYMPTETRTFPTHINTQANKCLGHIFTKSK